MKNKYGWVACIRNYRFHSIFIKNLLLISGLILLPMFFMLITSTYIYDQLRESEEQAYAEKMKTRISVDVEAVFKEVRDKAILLGADDDVKLFFYADTIEDDTYYDVKNIFNFVSLYKISSNVIEDVYVYATGSNVIISPAGRFSYEDFRDQPCIDQWEDNGEMFDVKLVDREIAKKRSRTLAFYYTTRSAAGNRGVVIININMEKLKKQLDYGDDVQLMILKNSQVIFDDMGVHTGEYWEKEDLLLNQTRDEFVISEKLELLGLEVILRMSSQGLNERLFYVKFFIGVCIGIMSLLVLVLVLYISKKIFDPINDILNILELESGTNENLLLQEKDEISYIRSYIYETLSKNKDIEEELAFRIKLLKKAQAVALQSQINPHFINNTLETIHWMSITKLGRSNEVSEMLNCLSQILRFSLGDTDTYVTLKEELEYVKKYLYIQQKRLPNGFDVIWDIDEVAYNCKVIKILIQPVIENAIKYGIQPYRDKGMLQISAKKLQDKLCIIVKDSGMGLTGKEVEEINHSIKKQVIKESNHIGLSNVNQRIILSFGENYGVTLDSIINRGTEVTLTLPYQL